MWWILIVGVVAVAAWFFFRTNKPERSQPPEKTLKELVAAPEVEAPPVTPSRSADAEPSQADSITIGKNLPLPLTLSGLSAADAKRLAKGLESNDWSTRGWLTLLVARNNVRCEEIDAWVAGARPKLEMAIKKGVAASAEWATASELDRADILEEITQEAVEALEVRPSDVDDARTLLKDEPADVTADDALLERFSGNTEAYIKLLSLLGSPGRVWQSAAGQYDRKEFETLVEMGFAAERISLLRTSCRCSPWPRCRRSPATPRQRSSLGRPPLSTRSKRSQTFSSAFRPRSPSENCSSSSPWKAWTSKA